jgi:hypothetical protein
MSDEINGSSRRTSSARRFFFQCPNIIVELGLPSQALALYSVIRRTAGDDGVCWRNTRDLARMAGMSVGSVVKAKRHLCGPFQLLNWKPLIQITKEPNRGGGKARHLIEIVNIWRENEKRYSQDEHDSSLTEQSRSSGDLPSSRSEIASSPSEIKKTPIRKLNEENSPSVSPSSREIECEDGSELYEFWNFVCTIFKRTDGREPTKSEERLMLKLLPVPPEEYNLIKGWMNLDSDEYDSKEEISFYLRRRPRSVRSLLQNWSNLVDVVRSFLEV